MANRRASTAICDSLFCTIAVITPVVFALAVYRNDLRKLLRILFVICVIFGTFLATRHAFYRLIYRVKVYFYRRRPQEEQRELEIKMILLNKNKLVVYPTYIVGGHYLEDLLHSMNFTRSLRSSRKNTTSVQNIHQLTLETQNYARGNSRSAFDLYQ